MAISTFLGKGKEKKTPRLYSSHEMELLDTKIVYFCGWNHRQWWISLSTLTDQKTQKTKANPEWPF
jgi:hypothetical protein